MPDASTQTRKRLLRRAVTERLRALDSVRFRDAGRSVAQRLTEFPQWREARTVCAFVSMAREIDTDELRGAAFAAGKTLCLPRVEGDDLSFRISLPSDQWALGPFGIREPLPSAATVDFALVPGPLFVVVPGLAFDDAGGRLGRGKGYYDRFLRTLRALRNDVFVLGIGLSEQLVESVPRTPFDESLDAVWCA